MLHFITVMTFHEHKFSLQCHPVNKSVRDGQVFQNILAKYFGKPDQCSQVVLGNLGSLEKKPTCHHQLLSQR